MGLILRTAVHLYETNCFSSWDVAEFLFSAGINPSSPVACVIQEIGYRFLCLCKPWHWKRSISHSRQGIFLMTTEVLISWMGRLINGVKRNSTKKRTKL